MQAILGFSPAVPWEITWQQRGFTGSEKRTLEGHKLHAKCNKLSFGTTVKKSLHLHNFCNCALGAGQQPPAGKKAPLFLGSAVYFHTTPSCSLLSLFQHHLHSPRLKTNCCILLCTCICPCRQLTPQVWGLAMHTQAHAHGCGRALPTSHTVQ